MNEISKIRIKVGVTVTVVLIILIYGISFLKDFKLGIETNELTVYFRNVNGLKEGDQVSVNGVPKGKVKTIELYGDSVKVTFTLEKNVTLKKDYSIAISMIELMSGKQISINPGKLPEQQDITKPLIGEDGSDIVTLIGTLNTISDDFSEMVKKLNQTAEKLNESIAHINEVVSDDQFKSDVKGTAFNFNVASKNFKFLLDENRSSLSLLTKKLNKIADDVDLTVAETSPDLKQTVENVKGITFKLDSLTNNLNKIILDAKDTNSTVGKLLTEDEMYENLNRTILNINKLIKQINKEGIRLRLF